MKLLIISHTDHYVDESGIVKGWGPTVREINFLSQNFEQVIHIACLYKNSSPPASSVAYNDNVKFMPIPPFGGNGLKAKLSILISAPAILNAIKKELKNVDVFQFRAPTSIGLYVIPYLTLFTKKKGWYKYAGNWMAKNTPISYALQRWMLNHQSRAVTINGQWENQQSNILPFENPCLYQSDRKDGEVVYSKQFTAPFRLCFAGRLDAGKGIGRIFEAIEAHPNKAFFSGLDIVGDGHLMQHLKNIKLSIPVTFHGALSREKLFEIYKQSDFLLLPSDSEGFPKVVAEAANFGCIPIVSDVSSIGQYVNETSGFLWNKEVESFTAFFSSINFSDSVTLKKKARNAYRMADAFTFDNYFRKLQNQVLK
ncbi:MAG: glycosyltransferase [Bacteroidetes bacterium]|nr:glycosyltransferase [Bacteroidota bacterium]